MCTECLVDQFGSWYTVFAKKWLLLASVSFCLLVHIQDHSRFSLPAPLSISFHCFSVPLWLPTNLQNPSLLGTHNLHTWLVLRPVHSSALIGEPSSLKPFCTPRPTAGQCAESEQFRVPSPKWGVFIKSLPSMLRGLWGRSKKIIRTRVG